MCRFTADLSKAKPDLFQQERLEELEKDGIIEVSGNRLRVTPAGRAFIRNVCAVFDRYLPANQSPEQTFSKAI